MSVGERSMALECHFILGFKYIKVCPLTEDPGASAADEQGEKFDPAFISINSIRGRALIAVVNYSWRVRRCTDAERKAAGEPPLTFAAMQGVREIFDAYLDIENLTLIISSI